ncbi:MAG: hypothetical protein M3198_15515 [Actinomycetota bacterium]|nr:hypothetical protein [Actinomycetota bacterium]
MRELRRRQTEVAADEDLLNEETFLERIYGWLWRRPTPQVELDERRRTTVGGYLAAA